MKKISLSIIMVLITMFLVGLGSQVYAASGFTFGSNTTSQPSANATTANTTVSTNTTSNVATNKDVQNNNLTVTNVSTNVARSNTTSAVNVTNTTSNLPQTGENDTILFVIAGTMILGLISYIKFRSVK